MNALVAAMFDGGAQEEDDGVVTEVLVRCCRSEAFEGGRVARNSSNRFAQCDAA
jgi:hypothetical protein